MLTSINADSQGTKPVPEIYFPQAIVKKTTGKWLRIQISIKIMRTSSPNEKL